MRESQATKSPIVSWVTFVLVHASIAIVANDSQ
jgi:hypothetical protein